MSYVIIRTKKEGNISTQDKDIEAIEIDSEIIRPTNSRSPFYNYIEAVRDIKLKTIKRMCCRMFFTLIGTVILLMITGYIAITIYRDLTNNSESENTDVLVKGIEAQALIDTSTQYEITTKDGIIIVPQNNGTYHYSSRFHHYPGFYSNKIITPLQYSKGSIFFIKLGQRDSDELIKIKVAQSTVRDLIYGFTGQMFVGQSANTLKYVGAKEDLPTNFSCSGLIYTENETFVGYVDPYKLDGVLHESGERYIPIPSFATSTDSYRLKCSNVTTHYETSKTMIYGREEFETKQDLVAYIEKIENEMRLNRLLPIKDLQYEVHVWKVGKSKSNRDRIILTNNFGLEIVHIYVAED